jgi:histidinol-phosphate aminotransferase
MWNALLARGILVRDVSAHPALANCLRITIGRPRENEALLAAVREVLG